ncbi:MAG: M15 family metallopeptidase [Hyphomicrobium sp.]|uniref:M15 family metallopeptidase n=1 Tax=Hyphomicrobium sp. TaxID=82 RepID=UPI001327C39B|nr:M15 family metallopeptidase [Hyphomicrobium sp.]KAB2941766.1 MAG: M15 family metallopeptidase [Hyphomicrobium sp.]MBZ0210302.1 M15 family metallopeptidase [Hyphomicrobium sp.]
MRCALAAAVVLLTAPAALAGSPPRGFVDVTTLIPDLVVDMRYATPHNFVGRPIPGYKSPRCYLTRPAAQALQCAADGLRGRGYALKVYDCYRPQRAVNAFVAWGRDLRDQKMKSAYYPDVDKRNLFRENYIASRSGHSRGSTVDLTMVPREAKPAAFDPAGLDIRACDSKAGPRTDDGSADMGTGFDCFSSLSHTASSRVNEAQRSNRNLLRTFMRGCGFYNNRSEWWHYTLRGEPYPNTFFDFPVE